MLKKYIISEISTLSKTKNDLSSFTNANFLHKVGAAGSQMWSIPENWSIQIQSVKNGILPLKSVENIEHKISIHNQIRSKHCAINDKTTLYFEDRYFLCQ